MIEQCVLGVGWGEVCPGISDPSDTQPSNRAATDHQGYWAYDSDGDNAISVSTFLPLCFGPDSKVGKSPLRQCSSLSTFKTAIESVRFSGSLEIQSVCLHNSTVGEDLGLEGQVEFKSYLVKWPGTRCFLFLLSKVGISLLQ